MPKIIAAILLVFAGLSFQSGFLADGAIEFFLNTALSVNLAILILSVRPMRCFHGAIRGLETDGLQILHAVRKRSR